MMRWWIPTKFVNKQGAIATLIFHGILDKSAFICQYLENFFSINKQNTKHSI